MSTPESGVKLKVKAILKAYAPHVKGHWPVQNGMGLPMLDYHGCCCGEYFAIETKAPGKKLTAIQEITKRDLVAAGARVFVILGPDAYMLAELDAWLHERVMRGLAEKRTKKQISWESGGFDRATGNG